MAAFSQAKTEITITFRFIAQLKVKMHPDNNCNVFFLRFTADAANQHLYFQDSFDCVNVTLTLTYLQKLCNTFCKVLVALNIQFQFIESGRQRRGSPTLVTAGKTTLIAIRNSLLGQVTKWIFAVQQWGQSTDVMHLWESSGSWFAYTVT